MSATQRNLQQEMSKTLITVGADDTLEDAYTMMIKHEIRHLPVLDHNNQIIGILSDRDLQRALQSEVSGAGSFLYDSYRFNPDKKVRDCMTWPVKSLSKDSNLKIAAQRMINEKISAFIVTETSEPNTEVVGIITSEDLLRVLCDLLSDAKGDFRLSIEELIANPKIGQTAQMIADIGI